MELTAYIYDAWAYDLAHQELDVELPRVTADFRVMGRLWILVLAAIANLWSVSSLSAATLEPSVNVAPWCNNLYLCDTSYMLEVQKLLEQRGFDVGAVDGVYGMNTKQAVMAFQKMQSSLVVDGIPGDKTMALLRQPSLSTTSRAVPNPTLPPTRSPITVTPRSRSSELSDFTRNALKDNRRSTVSEVGNLQILLKRRGFYDGAIDGVLGQSTTEAIMAAQRAYALDMDGFVGPLTMQALLAGGTNVAVSLPASNNIPSQDDVKKAQELMRDRGFYRGSIDGIYGTETKSSILKAQLAYGQASTGELTAPLLVALQSQERIARSPTSSTSPPNIPPNAQPPSPTSPSMPPVTVNPSLSPNINVNLNFPNGFPNPMSRQNMPL
ncbi:MAG: peptidoglycan-binding protein [Pseudanabaenaceae cyanobacterium bins.39]|nr:peptidoglycan-binding protein [Pseudanabaenaceae cyanobacterium bins.39]